MLWMIWAAEMARLHHKEGRSKAAPQWWVDYANAWGVMVSKPALQKSRPTYVEFAEDQNGSHNTEHFVDKQGHTTLKLGWGWKYWESIARTLMKVTGGVPGAEGYCGEQISAPGLPVHILDLPVSCGNIRPPTMVAGGEIMGGLISQWAGNHDARNNWDKYGVKVFSVIAKCLPVIGQLAGIVFSIVMDLVLAVVAFAFNMIAKLANGGKFTWADTIGIVENIAALTNAGLAEAGVHLSADDLMPEGTWNSLVTVGAEIKGWGGPVAATVRQYAQTVQNNFEEIRDFWGWDYLEEGYSTLVTGAVDVEGYKNVGVAA